MLFQFAILLSHVFINEGLKTCSNSEESTKSPTCFLVSSSLTTWQNAYEFCEQLGGDLISIVSDEEQQSLAQLLSTTVNDSIGLWIGLSDVNSPGNLQWADKSIFNYSHWQYAIPVWSLENEGNCVYITSQMEWTNDNCSSQKGFICNEKSQSFNNDSGCEHGKRRFRDSCYWMVDLSQSGWDEAENWCMMEGGHLAAIFDELENLFISSILMEANDAVWIGLRKTLSSDVPTWITNQSLNYSNWDSSPNLSSELCGMIDKNGLWIMQPCSSQHKAAVCEGPLSSDTTSEKSESIATFDFSVHCPLEWEQIDNRCYMIEKLNLLPWDEALTHCYSLGGNIASFSSSEDERFFFQLMSKMLDFNDIPEFWIGLKCSNYTPALSWVDGTPLMYDEQDSEQVYQMKNENPELDLCIAHSVQTYRWACLPCGSPLGSVCSMILTHQEEVTSLNPINPSPDSIASSTIQPSLWYSDDDCVGSESDLCGRSPTRTDLCPEAWDKLGQKCYKIEKDPLSWLSARRKCKNLGDDFDLVSIHSLAEQEFINEIKSMHKISVIWIGLNDKLIEGAFDWSDGSNVNFSQLIEPRRKQFQVIMDCVATKSDNEWTARECGMPLPYICQKVLSSQEDPAILAEPSTSHDYSNQPNTEETTAEYATQDYSSQSNMDLTIGFNTTTELSTMTYQSVEIMSVATTLIPDFSPERDTETVFATTIYYETDSELYNMTSENSENSPTTEGTQFLSIEPLTENDYFYTDTDPFIYGTDESPNSSEDTANDRSNSLDAYTYDMDNVGMSGGTIAGIVLGCLILTCLIVGGVIYFYTRGVPVPLLKDKYSFDNALYNPNGDDIQLQPDSFEI